MVRTLPCHGRGRGFESRRPRHSFQALASSELKAFAFVWVQQAKVAIAGLNPLNLSTKFGVWSMAVLLFGLPLLNCVTPAQAMTAAEQECCKKMAGECGRTGMAQSHSCCQHDGTADDHPLLKAAPISIADVGLPVAHFAPQFELLAPKATVLARWELQVHGPPGETPPNTTVLRI